MSGPPFDVNDRAHREFRQNVYRLLGMADDPAIEPDAVIDLTDHPAPRTARRVLVAAR